ncbi:hypothetical protein X946_4231 [Burkholderia sp. ABCPW 111]|nr:hypothetical protein X946_4231 [Burkholderia sp. ABCPW 111]
MFPFKYDRVPTVTSMTPFLSMKSLLIVPDVHNVSACAYDEAKSIAETTAARVFFISFS